ncbi:MAG: DUF2281 domain-containing protein [Candidatus Lokiarchaeota archaeon]|nr:DUF2281 domain-containing protein [Candidatus Lokiarchaeota archaeon]
MSKIDQIVKELTKFPDNVLDEIFDYILFLKGKLVRGSLEMAILSESSLEKDWTRPEEDEAWHDL